MVSDTMYKRAFFRTSRAENFRMVDIRIKA